MIEKIKVNDKYYHINWNNHHAIKIIERIVANDGYCPCSHYYDEDHICPCKDLREYGQCHCNLYEEEKDDEE